MGPGQAIDELRQVARTRWLGLYVAARLFATAFAAALLVWGGLGGAELLLLLYGVLSTVAVIYLPRLRRMPAAWAVDSMAALALVLASGDWRSPFYLLWLSTLALPAVSVPPRRALWLALGASLAFFVVAVVGGPVWGGLQVSSAETLAIHLALPLLLIPSLAYAADALRRLADERAARERLTIEAERRRIAWELHDSAKQRIHAAHLLVSSLDGRVPEAAQRTAARATVELESAASEMDASVAELSSPLEGRPLTGAARPRGRAGTRRASEHQRVRRGAAAFPAGRGACLSDRLRGDHERTPPRGRHDDRRLDRGGRRSPAGARARRRARHREPAPPRCARHRRDEKPRRHHQRPP